MKRSRFTEEQIIGVLREQGKTGCLSEVRWLVPAFTRIEGCSWY